MELDTILLEPTVSVFGDTYGEVGAASGNSGMYSSAMRFGPGSDHPFSCRYCCRQENATCCYLFLFSIFICSFTGTNGLPNQILQGF